MHDYTVGPYAYCMCACLGVWQEISFVQTGVYNGPDLVLFVVCVLYMCYSAVD